MELFPQQGRPEREQGKAQGGGHLAGSAAGYLEEDLLKTDRGVRARWSRSVRPLWNLPQRLLCCYFFPQRHFCIQGSGLCNLTRGCHWAFSVAVTARAPGVEWRGWYSSCPVVLDHERTSNLMFLGTGGKELENLLSLGPSEDGVRRAQGFARDWFPVQSTSKPL